MLRLKRVEIQGFKSFCDRTEMRFHGSGIAAIVGMLNPVKLAGGEAAIIVAAIDVLGCIIEMFITIIVAVEANPSAVLRPRRLFFPWVAYAPLPAAAHP